MPILTTDDELRAVLERSRTIAIVGLSNRPERDSYRVGSYLLQAGYTIVPVNPTLRDVFGLQVFPDLRSINVPVDLVDIFRRPEFIPDIIETALTIGVRVIWMQFGATHLESARRASDAGLAVVPDRCIMIEHRRLMR
jgi:predicted CoA-binding protein